MARRRLGQALLPAAWLPPSPHGGPSSGGDRRGLARRTWLGFCARLPQVKSWAEEGIFGAGGVIVTLCPSGKRAPREAPAPRGHGGCTQPSRLRAALGRESGGAVGRAAASSPLSFQRLSPACG